MPTQRVLVQEEAHPEARPLPQHMSLPWERS